VDDGVDFAVAAYRADNGWTVADLTREYLDDVETLAGALRHLPGDASLAMVAVDEDFFVVVRGVGTSTRVLLSDVTAADDWELARSALDFLGLPPPDDDDEQVPAGHLDLLADLGLSDLELTELLDDPDLYPDEVLSDVARALGFGPQFDDAVGLTSA
jgi:putative tRNA adenosine deaminase-associated protein